MIDGGEKVQGCKAMASMAASFSAMQLNVPSTSPKSLCLSSRRSWAGQIESATLIRTSRTTHRNLSLQVKAAASATAPSKFKTLKPLGDRVLVKIQTADEKTPGGILLPVSSQTKPQAGEVVAVGSGKTIADKNLEPSVSVGDMVVYSKYAGTEVQFSGTEHVLLKEDDLIGFLATDDIKDLKPLNERVMIKIAEAEEKTSGGIILTEGAKEKPVTGTVVAVGSGGYGEDGAKKPLDLTEGSSVMYSKYAGNEFKSKDGTAYIVIRAGDILAVLP